MTLEPSKVKAVSSISGLRVRVVLLILPVEMLPDESTEKYFVEPVESVISKISDDPPPDVCWTIKPVTPLVSGAMVLSAVVDGLVVRHVGQEAEPTDAQVGTPPEIVRTSPSLPDPPVESLAKELVESAYNRSPVVYDPKPVPPPAT